MIRKVFTELLLFGLRSEGSELVYKIWNMNLHSRYANKIFHISYLMCRLEDTLQKNLADFSESQDLQRHGNTKGLSQIGEA